MCQRRHARVHRNLCIKMRMKREAVEDDEDEDSYDENDDESDSESDATADPLVSVGRGGGSMAVPGLTPVQIRVLLDLAARADSEPMYSSLDKLQQQVSELTADKQNGRNAPLEQGAPGASLKEIKRLHEKLNELETKTCPTPAASCSPRSRRPRSAPPV